MLKLKDTKRQISVGLVVILVIITVLYLYMSQSVTGILHPTRNANLSDIAIIQLLKDRYPELDKYPTIKSEHNNNTWYIGFVKEGREIPILDARCFSIDTDNTIIEGEFVAASRLSDTSFSPQNCSTINYQY